MLTLVLTVGAALAFLLLIARATGDESVGYGASLEINDGASNAFAAVPKLEKLGVPNETTGTVESKTLDMEDAVIRKLPTLKDGGTFSFTYEVIQATYDRIETIRAARSIKQFKVIIPLDEGDLEITVQGFISANALEDIEAEKITVGNVTVVVSGPRVTGGASIAAKKAATAGKQTADRMNGRKATPAKPRTTRKAKQVRFDSEPAPSHTAS